jgi:hypothetical protein
MAKIVKLNIKDIENIVKKTISESEFDDFITKTQFEELPDSDNFNSKDDSRKTMVIGKGEDGKIYAIDSESGEILGVK